MVVYQTETADVLLPLIHDQGRETTVKSSDRLSPHISCSDHRNCADLIVVLKTKRGDESSGLRRSKDEERISQGT